MTSPLNVGTNGRVLYYDVGRSASVVMLAQDGGLALRTNGLPEALMDSPGSLQRFSGEFWLSPLAVIARPKARDMLIVGFGGGVVVEGVPPSVRHVDVIELEPKVIEANRVTGQLRKRNPLADPRVNIIVNDARGALRLTDRRYDAIVSQPSHPWTAGASHLYTREFMQLAHDHLNSGGVFVQWMNVIFMDEDLLRSLTATLLKVFPEVRVYRPDPNTVVFLASDAPLDVELELARSGLPLARCTAALRAFRHRQRRRPRGRAGARLGRRAAHRHGRAADHRRRQSHRHLQRLRKGTRHDRRHQWSPVRRARSTATRRFGGVRAAQGSLSFPYLARRNGVFVLLDPSLADRVGRMSQFLAGDARGEYLRAYYYRMKNQAQRSTETLRLAIDDYPADDSLRLEFLRPWYGELAMDKAPAEIAEVADGLNAPAAQRARRGATCGQIGMARSRHG